MQNPGRGALDNDDINWADYDVLPPKRNRSPWVLVGTAMTAGVLCVGLVAFKRGNTGMSQRMMRARVMLQAATVAVMVGSSGYVAMSKEAAPATEKIA